MAKTKSSTQLPGLSRSVACNTVGCHRLLGHLGDHRSTLTKSAKGCRTMKPKASAAQSTKSTKAGTTKPEAWQGGKDDLGPEGTGTYGGRRLRSTKSTKARKNRSKTGRVKVLPMVEPKARLGIERRAARRPKAAPKHNQPESTTPNRVVRAKLGK